MTDEFPGRSCKVGEVLLRAENLSARHRFAGVSFEVRAGEVFALTGLVGSGRSSVAKTLFGAIRATAGGVTLGDRRGPFVSPRQAVAAGLAMLPEDRQREGLLLERNLRENLTLARREAAATAGFLNIRRERTLARSLMTNLQIRAVSTESPVSTLSGGNQQKALLARWMSRPHRCILFDEPTRGVDVGAKYEIYTLINRLATEGAAVVMISSELPEVIGMADRIGVMYSGRMTGVLENRQRRVTQEDIMRLAAGEGVAA
jgi:ribose transport system ATP-binding protein